MSTTTPAEQNEQLVRRFTDEVVNEGALDRVEEFVTDDVIDHTPFGETKGSDGVRTTMETVRTAFLDFTVTPTKYSWTTTWSRCE